MSDPHDGTCISLERHLDKLREADQRLTDDRAASQELVASLRSKHAEEVAVIREMNSQKNIEVARSEANEKSLRHNDLINKGAQDIRRSDERFDKAMAELATKESVAAIEKAVNLIQQSLERGVGAKLGQANLEKLIWIVVGAAAAYFMFKLQNP